MHLGLTAARKLQALPALHHQLPVRHPFHIGEIHHQIAPTRIKASTVGQQGGEVLERQPGQDESGRGVDLHIVGPVPAVVDLIQGQVDGVGVSWSVYFGDGEEHRGGKVLFQLPQAPRDFGGLQGLD